MAVAVSTGKLCEQILELGLIPEKELEAVATDVGDSDDSRSLARRLVKDGLLTKWQATILINGRRGLRIGKYVLKEEIGVSSMGRTYLAEHVQMKRQVALRTISRRHTKDPKTVKRFLDDARTLASLDHRNLIHVYDIDSEGDRYYLVTEFVPNGELQTYVQQNGPLPPLTAVEYVRQAAVGLQYAHEQNLLHRDLTPETLFVDDAGVVKLADIGLSRLADSESSDLPASDSDLGNPTHDYQAPEVENSSDATVSSDIYSLGVTLAYLVTGKVVRSIDTNDPPEIEGRMDDGVKLRFWKIVAKMIAKTPSNRFHSAEQVATFLGKWLHLAETAEEKRRPPKKAIPLEEEDDAMPFVVSDKPRWASDSEEDLKPVDKPQPAKTSSEEEGDGSKKKNMLVPLLIGGGALVLLLMFSAIGGGAYFLFFSGDDSEQVADNSTDTAVTPDPSEEDNEDDHRVTPEEEEPEEPKFPTPGSGLNPDGEEPENPDGGMPGENPDGGEEDPQDPDGMNQDPMDPDPMMPDPMDPTDPMENREDPKDPDGNPDENPTENPDPDKPDPQDPKDPPKDPKEPKPPKDVDPFKDLGTAIALTPIESTPEPLPQAPAPISLGPMPLKDGALVFGSLLGGDTTGKSNLFAMAATGTQGRNWDITVESSKPGQSSVKIATLAAVDGELQFNWTAEAAAEPVANYLQNCVISLRTGNFARDIALRQPEEKEGVAFSMDKPMRFTEKFDFMPDVSTLRVEITGVPETLPQHSFTPAANFEADGGEALSLVNGATADDAMFQIHYKAATRRDVQVTMTPMFKISGMPAPQAFNMKKLTQAYGQATALQVSLTQQLAQVNAQIKAMGNANNAQAKQLKQSASLLESQNEQLQTAFNEFEKVKTLYEQINDKGSITYRIYRKVGDAEINLITTTPVAMEAPAEEAAAN